MCFLIVKTEELSIEEILNNQGLFIFDVQTRSTIKRQIH
ncbi:hypothetical protein BTN49_0415 [Candidatus Enterovibrio escicola]|uniref:Uncharacterized protein n=1 Tax=Candidatus Enterovibrio escicola TaxID=1927127 RepID=A0A2A5T5K4_9GAMM|nr:hypothetical protein BTN49_0415 [Candidatus Enterovibrio escacola]